MKKILCVLLAFAVQTTFANPYEIKEMVDRVKPVGEVKVAGMADESSDEKPAEKAKPLTGPEVYNKFCVACHGAGIAGAPKYKNAGAWASRKGKGLDGLTKSAIKGINAMPPKGTCSTCTDDQIKAAIKYMLP